ncbi:hypothetical protein [Gordonia sp. VNK21]|uniref:hypothetical protein n=1 Tax=Gordonia sp. VNK21 TaxID=3382483 RepID=UPI0038D48E24
MTAPGVPNLIDPQVPGVRFGSLVRVESRKLTDSRGALGVLIALGVLLLIITITGMSNGTIAFDSALSALSATAANFLAIIAIMLVTAEWSQRSVVSTFTLEPRRERVVVAKALAALALGAVAFVVCLLLAWLISAVNGETMDHAGEALVSAALYIGFLVLMGFAFALLLLNTPGAIVAFFILPTLLVPLLVGLVSDQDSDAQTWVTPSMALDQFTPGTTSSGSPWLPLLVCALVWIVLPGALGAYRVQVSEVK